MMTASSETTTTEEPVLTDPLMLNITPTMTGYQGMVALFADSIIRDVKVSRKADSKHLMASIIEIAAYLGSVGGGNLTHELVEEYRR